MLNGVHFAHPWALALLALLPVWFALRFVPRVAAKRRASLLFSRVDLLGAQASTWRARLERRRAKRRAERQCDH